MCLSRRSTVRRRTNPCPDYRRLSRSVIGAVEIAQSGLDLLDVSGHSHLGENPSDPTVAVDDDGGALDTHVLAAIHRFLLPDTESVGELVSFVGEKTEGELILFLEFAM